MVFRLTKVVASRPKLSWLDLRGSSVSALERLCLEESLLRHDSRNWAVVGTHEPTTNRFLSRVPLPQYIQDSENRNISCVVIMGIGGKPEELLDVKRIKEDGILVLKRFSGGGTVVLDHNSLWTTFIGRKEMIPGVETSPRSIMKWSADAIFERTFDELTRMELRAREEFQPRLSTMVVDSKSCGAENSGKVVQVRLNKPMGTVDDIHSFQLREHDYVLGDRKVGGNAQSITKAGWLHHTSFLWDFDDDNMSYLSLPSKRPEYRGDRSHSEFLRTLRSTYTNLRSNQFFSSMKIACESAFDVEITSLRDAMSVVGDIQEWFDGKCRTKVQHV